MTAVLPVPMASARDHGSELDHVFCRCRPDRGLCGADVAGHEVQGAAAVLTEPCVVCVDLEDKPCARCGR